MANHKSSEKRARQTEKRTLRNRAVKAKVKTLVKKALDSKKDEDLREAMSAIQKARSVFHINTIKRKTSRLAKAFAQTAKKAS